MYVSDAFDPNDADRPAFRREGLGYVYEPQLGDTGGGLVLRLDYIKKGLESHSGEVTIESTLPGMRGLLHQARYNLVSSTAQPNLVKAIKHVIEGTPDADLDWAKWVRTFFALALAAEREGEPFRATGPAMPRQVRLAPLVHRLVPMGQNVLLYGPGGTGKGWIAVGIALCVSLGIPFAGHETQQANVLYLDWEDTFEVFSERVACLAAGLLVKPPVVHHRECYGSLREQVHQIARQVAEQHIGLLVVDSVEMAAAFAGEASTYEDRARGLFEALRAVRGGLGRPMSVLLIDHVSEAGRAQASGTVKPYGSVFKGNWSRLGWEVRKQQDAEALTSHVGLYQWKSNHSAQMGAVGLRIEWDDPFEPNAVSIAGDEVGEYEDLAKRLGLKDRIKAVLARQGPLTPKEIATMTELGAEKVRAVLSRDAGSPSPWFRRLEDNRYALAEEGPRGPHLSVVPAEKPRLPYAEEGIADEEILF